MYSQIELERSIYFTHPPSLVLSVANLLRHWGGQGGRRGTGLLLRRREGGKAAPGRGLQRRQRGRSRVEGRQPEYLVRVVALERPLGHAWRPPGVTRGVQHQPLHPAHQAGERIN